MQLSRMSEDHSRAVKALASERQKVERLTGVVKVMYDMMASVYPGRSASLTLGSPYRISLTLVAPVQCPYPFLQIFWIRRRIHLSLSLLIRIQILSPLPNVVPRPLPPLSIRRDTMQRSMRLAYPCTRMLVPVPALPRRISRISTSRRRRWLITTQTFKHTHTPRPNHIRILPLHSSSINIPHRNTRRRPTTTTTAPLWAMVGSTAPVQSGNEQ